MMPPGLLTLQPELMRNPRWDARPHIFEPDPDFDLIKRYGYKAILWVMAYIFAFVLLVDLVQGGT